MSILVCLLMDINMFLLSVYLGGELMGNTVWVGLASEVQGVVVSGS